MVGIIVGLIAAYLVFQSGILAQFGIGPGAATAIANSGGPVQTVAPTVTAASIQQEQQVATGGIGAATSAASSLSASGGLLSNQVSSGVASAIPIVGAAFSIIASTLLAASAARAKAATNENAAVAAAIPGWDNAIAQIANAYNAGSLTVTQAQALFAQTLINYWNEMQGKIQSGRNGCNYGANCPPSVNPSSDQATAIVGASNYCSGSIGAACCIGCADLALSVANLQWAVAQADKSGSPAIAFIQVVYASKYGGANRAAYYVTLTPPNPANAVGTVAKSNPSIFGIQL